MGRTGMERAEDTTDAMMSMKAKEEEVVLAKVLEAEDDRKTAANEWHLGLVVDQRPEDAAHRIARKIDRAWTVESGTHLLATYPVLSPKITYFEASLYGTVELVHAHQTTRRMGWKGESIIEVQEPCICPVGDYLRLDSLRVGFS